MKQNRKQLKRRSPAAAALAMPQFRHKVVVDKRRKLMEKANARNDR